MIGHLKFLQNHSIRNPLSSKQSNNFYKKTPFYKGLETLFFFEVVKNKKDM